MVEKCHIASEKGIFSHNFANPTLMVIGHSNDKCFSLFLAALALASPGAAKIM
jgi:hypothetical protein